jgi:uncharacterized SAM-binding protein YcdF (DUF218 family)
MIRRRLRWVGAGTLAGIALVAVAFLGAGHFLVNQPQEPEEADLIVVLGGDNGSRVDKAAELYAKGFAPKVLLTGLEGGHAKTRLHYLNWRAQYLVDQGVPQDALLLDRLSASSWDEAVNTLRLMQSANLSRVLVVSDPPHLRRLRLAWGKVFAGSGKEFVIVPALMENWDAARWWDNSASAQFVIAEYIKLVYYLATY